MEGYNRLYRMTVRHEYFGESPCPSLKLRISPGSEALMHRRGMMVREETAGSWSLFFTEEPDTDTDVLYMDLCITDPAFVLYTDWSGFRPADSYELQLPESGGELDAVSSRSSISRCPTKNSAASFGGTCCPRNGWDSRPTISSPLPPERNFPAGPSPTWCAVAPYSSSCPARKRWTCRH